jgi:hypothetical protein
LTLTITIVAPWNVWQCSDHRVTYMRRTPNGQWEVLKREDRSVKHVYFRCPDGAALLAYSGLAMVGSDHISDWLRRQTRGYTRTVDQTLIRIREAATADLTGPAKAGGIPHAFLVGAYLQHRPWAVAITNTTGPPDFPVLDQFETVPFRADKPKVMIFGEGQDAISDKDRKLLRKAARHRAAQPENYSLALFAVAGST